MAIFGLASVAGDAPVPKEDLRRLVEDLAEPAFERREAAFRKLLVEGGRDPERVLAALPEDPSSPGAAYCDDLRARIPWEVRKRKALALAGDAPELREAIEALYVGPSPQALREIAGKAGPRKGAAARIIAEFLAHKDRAVRMFALRLLAGLNEPAVLANIAPLLDGEDRGERSFAAVALLRLGGEDAGLRDPGLVERARAWWEQRLALAGGDPPPQKHPCSQPPPNSEISE